MAQNININPISIGSSHDSSTTYTFTVDSGTVTLFGGDPATGISKASLEAGLIITVSDDSLIYATCTVDNGTCQGQTSVVYWFNGAIGTWQTGGNLSYTRINSGGAGEQAAALAFGGTSYTPSTTFYATSETYDGSVWTVGANLNNSREASGTGTQNAALAIGRRPLLNSTEEYNGTSWSIGGNLLVSKAFGTSTGVQNAALSIGNNSFPNSSSDCIVHTEEYNGGTWSLAANANTLKQYPQGAGNVDSTLILGGYSATNTSICTEKYNGISWTSDVPLPNAICDFGISGISNSTIAFGGLGQNPFNSSLGFNGTSWSTCNGLINPIYKLEGIGTKTAMAIGGGFPTRNHTEEYSELLSTSTTPTPPPSGTTPPSGVGVWSTGQSFTTPRYFLASAGEQNSALVFGGCVFPTITSATEKYNGTSWTSSGALITARYGLGGAGIQNAALAFGGQLSFSNQCDCTEEYNGTSWCTSNSLNNKRSQGASLGTQNAALFAGGICSGFRLSCTEEYDGVSWSNASSLSATVYQNSGAGTQNSGLSVASSTLEYDGNVWSQGGNPNFKTCRHGSAGTAQNYALAFGGYNLCTEEYDGGIWSIGGTSTICSLSGTGAGSQSAALKMGGVYGSTAVERYNK